MRSERCPMFEKVVVVVEVSRVKWAVASKDKQGI